MTKPNAKSPFQLKVEEMLLKYINRFLRYLRFGHIPPERKKLLVGCFNYLLNETDLVPDDVPNIGLLDDLMVFVNVANAFVQGGQTIPGVCNPEEVLEDMQFIDKNKGMMFGSQALSIDIIRKSGNVECNLEELCEQIKSKYAHLGKVEA